MFVSTFTPGRHGMSSEHQSTELIQERHEKAVSLSSMSIPSLTLGLLMEVHLAGQHHGGDCCQVPRKLLLLGQAQVLPEIMANGQFMPDHIMPNQSLSCLIMANQLIRFKTSVCDCVALEKDIHQFTAILFCPVPTNREAAGAMGEKVRATIV